MKKFAVTLAVVGMVMMLATYAVGFYAWAPFAAYGAASSSSSSGYAPASSSSSGYWPAASSSSSGAVAYCCVPHLLPAVDTPMVACLLLQAAAVMHIAACLLLQAAAEITGLQLLQAVVTILPAAHPAAGTKRYRSATI